MPSNLNVVFKVAIMIDRKVWLPLEAIKQSCCSQSSLSFPNSMFLDDKLKDGTQTK